METMRRTMFVCASLVAIGLSSMVGCGSAGDVSTGPNLTGGGSVNTNDDQYNGRQCSCDKLAAFRCQDQCFAVWGNPKCIDNCWACCRHTKG
jgi:hypothetical protein